MESKQIDRLCGLLERLLSRYENLPEEVDRMRGQMIRLEAANGGIDKRLQHVEVSAENTGNIYVGDLKEKLRKYEGTQTHWVRYVIAATVTLVFIGVSALLGYALKR